MSVKNRIVSFAMLFTLLIALVMPVFAAEGGITPYYNNTGSTETAFVIDENGNAIVSYICFGYEGITTNIVVYTKIEKKFLWWWNDVDGASWTDETVGDHCCNEHSIQLTKSGTYRATVTYTVYGIGGQADVITRELEYEY